MENKKLLDYLNLKIHENKIYSREINSFEDELNFLVHKPFPLHKNKDLKIKDKQILLKESILLKQKHLLLNKKYISYIQEILKNDIYPE